MFNLSPRGEAACDQGLDPSQSLQLLEAWLQEICEWLSRLIFELSAVRQVIGSRFLAESEALIGEHRELFLRLLPKLLELELDITGIGRQFEAFERLCGSYQALVAELKTPS